MTAAQAPVTLAVPAVAQARLALPPLMLQVAPVVLALHLQFQALQPITREVAAVAVQTMLAVPVALGALAVEAAALQAALELREPLI
jgi:hypothetical protein